ncbi:MAG: MFS transporter [Acidimicrobiales bacterium]|jgi:MFS family permease
MTSVRAAVRQTFSSLRTRNYRLYFTAQLISVSGTWMQTVAQAWLVLHLSGSSVDLGLVVGLQFLPMLLFGPFGGLVADRVNKRKLLYATQSAGGLLALVLGALVVSHAVQLWQVYLLATLLGFVNVFDNPARQTFVMEMVGREDLPNAVSLNTVVMNASRVVGPAIGGVVIVLFGLGICFFVNAASYVAVLIGLAMMRSRELHPTEHVSRAKGQIREGFRYVWRTPSLRNTLLAIAIIGIFAYNFTVTLAVLAKVTFHGGAGAYSLLTSCMGFGAVIGGLLAAHRARPTPRLLQVLALVFGGLLAAVALAPTLLTASILIVFMGAASIGFIATANATLQLSADPTMRGRVMALYAMAFLGTTPIGAPLVGAIAQWTNPRVALLVGAAATVMAAGVLMWRHQVGLRRVDDDSGLAHDIEVEAVRDVESHVA